MERMQTLDDARNSLDVDGVARFHKPDVVVYWPGQLPTRGMDDHRAEALAFFNTFPDQHLDNRPYKTLFTSGDWTCSIAHFTGTMRGPMGGPDGKQVRPLASRSRWTSALSPTGTTGRSLRSTSSTI